jgi:hypothetical protein
MRPEVWPKFQKRYRRPRSFNFSVDILYLLVYRYNVKHVVEFYAATEGNIGLFNSCDKEGGTIHHLIFRDGFSY